MRTYLTSRLLPVVCFPLLISLLLFQSCGEANVTDKTPRKAEDARVKAARIWADSVMATMSLPEMVGQLLMLEAPEAGDYSADSLFLASLQKFHAGGIYYRSGNPEVRRGIVYRARQQSTLPLMTGGFLDAAWLDDQGHPSWIQACAGPDSVLEDWAYTLALEHKAAGAHVLFTPAGNYHGIPVQVATDSLVGGAKQEAVDTLPAGEVVKVDSNAALKAADSLAALAGAESTKWLPGIRQEMGLGSSPEMVLSRSLLLASGVRKAGIMPCASLFSLDESVDTFPVIRHPVSSLWERLLFPLEQMVNKRIEAVQIGPVTLTSLDSLYPAPLSLEVYDRLLRKDLSYRGLLFSPVFRDTLFQNQYGAGEAEFLCLQAGADVVVGPRDVLGTIARITQAVEKKQWGRKDLELRVRRVLMHKHLLGLDQFRPVPTDSLPDWKGSPGLALKSRLVHEASLTLLNNDKDRLPLSRVENSDLATLFLGAVRKTPFQWMIDRYMNAKHYVQSKISAGGLKTQLGRLKDQDYAIVGILPEVLDSTGRLDSLAQSFLKRLNGETRLVCINFGSVNALEGLDSLTCVVQAWQGSGLMQELAAQLVMGGLDANGRLPVAVAGSFGEGEGVITDDVIRFKYTIPEEVGIAKQALKRIDSIARVSINLGVFPGCQIFAAKDGKVFYHKSFGHHTYSRRQRVRKSDLYDLASITKVAATTLAAMASYDMDSLEVTDSLWHHIEEVDSNHIKIRNIKLEDLLIHKAGLPPGLPTYYYFTVMDSVDSVRTLYYSNQEDSMHTVEVAENLWFNAQYLDTLWEQCAYTPVYGQGRYTYSDFSMFLMKEAVEHEHEASLDKLTRRWFYGPMGLRRTAFNPLRRFEKEEVVPTENDRFFRKRLIHGFVHDPTAALLGGVGGHAGLFSNAHDLAVVFQMLLNKGTYGGRRYLSRGTVNKFTGRHWNSHRGLGFDMQTPSQDRSMVAASAAPTTYGHLGFTGTCVWADPENQVLYVFLSNRVHPKSSNKRINIYRVRQSIQQVIYDALGIYPVRFAAAEEAVKDTSAVDSSAVALADSAQKEPVLP